MKIKRFKKNQNFKKKHTWKFENSTKKLKKRYKKQIFKISNKKDFIYFKNSNIRKTKCSNIPQKYTSFCITIEY